MALPLKCQHMAPRSLPVAGVTRRRAEPAAAARPRRAGAHGARTALGHAGRDGQGQAARWVSAADAHARWACEDEGEAEAEVDVSVKGG